MGDAGPTGEVMSWCGVGVDEAKSLLAIANGNPQQAIQEYLELQDQQQEEDERKRKNAERAAKRVRTGSSVVNAAGRIAGPPRRSARPDCDRRTTSTRWAQWKVVEINPWDATIDPRDDRSPPQKLRPAEFSPGGQEWRGASAVLSHLCRGEQEGEPSHRISAAQVQVQAESSHVEPATGATVSQDTSTHYATVQELRDSMNRGANGLGEPGSSAAYFQVFYGQTKDSATKVLAGMPGTDGGGATPVQFIPRCVQLAKVEKSLIIFVSVTPTFSGTHRDATPSILHCVWGVKVVWLAPPDITERESDVYKVLSDHPDWLDYDPFKDEGAASPGGAWRRCTLMPGESLYIPTGWWHNVYSTENTVGISALISGAVGQEQQHEQQEQGQAQVAPAAAASAADTNVGLRTSH
jgi:hypothetical protein